MVGLGIALRVLRKEKEILSEEHKIEDDLEHPVRAREKNLWRNERIENNEFDQNSSAGAIKNLQAKQD